MLDRGFYWSNILEIEKKLEQAFEMALISGIRYDLQSRILDIYFDECALLIKNSTDKKNLMKLIIKFSKSTRYKEHILKNMTKYIISHDKLDKKDYKKLYGIIENVWKIPEEAAKVMLDSKLEKYKKKLNKIESETTDKLYTLKRSLVFKKGPEIVSEVETDDKNYTLKFKSMP